MIASNLIAGIKLSRIKNKKQKKLYLWAIVGITVGLVFVYLFASNF